MSLTSTTAASDAEHIEADGSAGDVLVDRADNDPPPAPTEPTKKRSIRWSSAIVFVLIPALALLLTAAAGFLKWRDGTARSSDLARVESVQAAKDTTVALLSYKPDTAERELPAAAQRMTGSFKKQYQDLIASVVIPGSKEQRISAAASVPAIASVSATPAKAVVLLFVNQTTTIGGKQPTDMQSSVRVTMDKVDGRWLMSAFEPI